MYLKKNLRVGQPEVVFLKSTKGVTLWVGRGQIPNEGRLLTSDFAVKDSFSQKRYHSPKYKVTTLVRAPRKRWCHHGEAIG